MLRQLKNKDVCGMLEWMKEDDTKKYFRFDTKSMDEEKAKKFISDSFNEYCKHYAVTDDNDEYLGTISLKNINYHDANAEYAISLRNIARGNGTAYQATEEILMIAFENLKLKKVYLNVLSDNCRAISFYEKFGFRLEGEFRKHVCVAGEWKDLKWYAIDKEQFYERKNVL